MKERIPPLRSAFLATGALFLLGFLVFRPHYLTNDDALLAMLAQGSGVLDRPCEVLLFINILLGWSLQALYSSFPLVPWYALTLYLLLFASTWAMASVLIDRVRGLLPRAAAYALFSAFFFHLFVFPHYTAIALWGVLSGILLFLYPLPASRGTSAALLFFSSLLRWEALPFCLALALPLWSLRDRKEGRVRAAALAVGLTLAAGAFALDQWVYRTHPGLEEGRRYAQAYNLLVEYKMPDYGTNQEAFQAAGWSLNDYAMYIRWFWWDPKFDLEACEKLAQTLGYDLSNKWRRWKPTLTSLGNLTFVFLGGLLLLFTPRASRSNLTVLLAGMAGATILLALFRKAPEWVLFPPWAFFILLCLLHLPAEPRKGRPKPLVLLLALCLLFSFSLLKGTWSRDRARSSLEDPLITALDRMGGNQERLFLVFNQQIPFEVLPIFGERSRYRGPDLVWFSWAQRIPQTAERLARYGLREPLRDMAGRKDVFLVLNDIDSEVYRGFMRENYAITPLPERIPLEAPFKVYRIKAGP